MTTSIHRGTITKLTADGAYVSIPTVSGLSSIGPCEVIPNDYSIGDIVAVANVSESTDDLAILGILTTDAQEEIIDAEDPGDSFIYPDGFGLIEKGAAVADATDNASAITQLNALLASLRASGAIET